MIVVRFAFIDAPAKKQVKFLPFASTFEAISFMADMYGDTVHVSYAAPVKVR